LEPEELLIPSLSLSSLESRVLLSQVSTEILLSLSRQLNVDCRILKAEEARTFVEHVTRTYGPLRATS
jgi:2'-5' RNA ligase